MTVNTNKPLISVVAERVTAVRATTGLSRESFALVIGLPATSLKNIERGTRESRFSVLYDICLAFKHPQQVLSFIYGFSVQEETDFTLKD